MQLMFSSLSWFAPLGRVGGSWLPGGRGLSVGVGGSVGGGWVRLGVMVRFTGSVGPPYQNPVHGL